MVILKMHFVLWEKMTIKMDLTTKEIFYLKTHVNKKKVEHCIYYKQKLILKKIIF